MTKQVLKAYKVRLYPNREQTTRLNKTFGCVRFVWNRLVDNFNSYPNHDPNFNEQTLKRSGDCSWLYEISNCTLQQKRMDFEQTKRQFFNPKRKIRIGRMKFKNKRSRQSFRLTNQKFKVLDNKIQLEKIGQVKAKFDRNITGELRSVTVSRTPSGKYFASILVREEPTLISTTGKSVGIDVGLTSLYSFSDGRKVDNPRWFHENQVKLSKAQKHLSRKKKGSNRYEKQRVKVAKVHEDVVNKRTDFIHKMTTDLVREYDLISVEDLNVSGMTKNRNLSKSIINSCWFEFVRQLEYKCKWYGKTLIKIDRWFASSQICSSCGHSDGNKELNVRNWKCSECGTPHDRDTNAAINILNKGISELSGIEFLSAESVDYKRGEDVSLSDSLDSKLLGSVEIG